MTYKTTYWDSATQTQKERDCTPEEVAEIEARKANAQANADRQHNEAVKAQIAALDLKRIRPLAEGDTAYLATLNAQIQALRATLK